MFVADVFEQEEATTIVEQDKAVLPLLLDLGKKANFGSSRRRWRRRRRREGEATRAKGRTDNAAVGKRENGAGERELGIWGESAPRGRGIVSE